jgi:2,4-dienoyl-CoA reductase-like NADH-dependent reductase (Old Yellow Enzyme family)
MIAALFQPFELRNLRLENRIVVSPMQTYSAADALATAWHRTHLARFALGGAGLVMIEATAVSPEGRSTYTDLGLWSDAQEEALRALTETVLSCGAAVGIQLQHAGRKASTSAPWQGFAPVPFEPGIEVIGPTADPAAGGGHTPRAMEEADMDRLVAAYVAATRRADRAGVELVEIHMAHGYLLHSFLSPLSNRRTDAFGGSLENRMRFPLRIVGAVREAWSADKPLACRISSIDGVGIGWSMEDSRLLAARLREQGVDLVDCSSGGMTLPRKEMLVPRGPGFQVPFAARLRAEAGVATIAVGGITDAAQADAIVAKGKADLVAVGRQMLANPNWALDAAETLLTEGRWERWPVPFGWWLERRHRAGGSA